MVPPYSHRVSRVRRYSGYSLLNQLFAYRIFTFFDWPSHTIQLSLFNALHCPNPGNISTPGLASSAFARHYWRNLCWFLFLALLRCFSSGGSPHIPMYSVYDDKTLLLPDCSIRISTDLTLTYSSPWLFAVSHVLLRLSVPRHSPCALCSLTIFKSSSYRTLDQIRPLFNVLVLTANVLRFCAARFLTENIVLSEPLNPMSDDFSWQFLFELKQIKL